MGPDSLTESLRETVALFENSGVPLTTSEVADLLDLGRRSTYDRLDRLVEHGRLETKKVGANGRVWWRPAAPADGRGGDGPATAESLADVAEDRVAGATGDGTRLRRREGRLEGRRDGLDGELAAVFDRIDDGFFALDDEWRFVHANDRAATLLDSSTDDLVGREVWEAFPEAVGSTFQEQYERAFDAQETVTFEEFYPPLDTWFEVSAYPSEDGLSVYFRDVTGRKERQRELDESRRQLRTLVEHFPNGAVTLVDGDLRYVTVGGEPIEEVDATPVDLEGRRIREALPPALADLLVPRYEAALDGERSTFEERIGDRHYQFRVLPVRDSDGTVSAAMGMSQDVTERREYERDLELYETIVSTMEDGVYVLDGDFRFVMVNDAYAEMTGYDREELLGAHCSLVVDEEVAAASAEMLENDAGGVLEADIDRADGGHLRAESRFSTLSPRDGAATWKVGVVRDVTGRVARERELERRVRQQEVVSDLGQRALDDRDVEALLADAVELVADVLDADYCEAFDRDADAGELRLRQGVGWDDGGGETTVPADAGDSQAAYTLRADRPVVVTDMDAETRFSGPALLADHDVHSGISTIIGSPDDPWGVLGAHDTASREFSDHDVTFVQSVAATLASAIARRDHERKLLRQGEQLAALDHLNRVVREITGQVINQSTREEIEATVCEHLADSESYLFAWIGEIDVGSQAVRLRTEAGVEGYLDGVEVSVDPDEEGGAGPTGRACRTGEIQVVQDVDPARDPEDHRWRAHAAEYGFRAFAAVPIVHEGTVYGALDVYAERPMAFEGQERTVLAQLGEVVGHAIAAAERKRSLLSDEVVELEFHVPGIFDVLGIDPGPAGRVTIDHAIPLGGEAYLVYGRANADGVESVRAITGALPHWQGLTVREGGTDARFELHLSEPPVLSEIAAVGGSIAEATIEDGDYRMTVQVSPGGDVRRIVEAVEAAYPAAHLLRRRQITRSDVPSDRVGRVLTDDLTERQRTALEAAYHAGHFAWPRDASGEEVAESLGIAPSTFHQHLRKAQRKVFDHVFATATARS